MMLSHGALAVLDQLARGPCWDGDLIDKMGRTELCHEGLANRSRSKTGLPVNYLTLKGRELAAAYQHTERPGRLS